MSSVVDLGAGGPTPEEIRRYAESQAHRMLQMRGIACHERSFTAYFMPTARTNLEAVANWVHEYLCGIESLQAYMLRGVSVNLPNRLDLAFEDRLEDVRSASPFGF